MILEDYCYFLAIHLVILFLFQEGSSNLFAVRRTSFFRYSSSGLWILKCWSQIVKIRLFKRSRQKNTYPWLRPGRLRLCPLSPQYFLPFVRFRLPSGLFHFLPTTCCSHQVFSLTQFFKFIFCLKSLLILDPSWFVFWFDLEPEQEPHLLANVEVPGLRKKNWRKLWLCS